MANDANDEAGNGPHVGDSPDIAPVSDATPEGFARFKAGTLKLTPLEVLLCLESLSTADQHVVVSAHQARINNVAEAGAIGAEIKSLEYKLQDMKRTEADMLRRLETHHPEPVSGGWTVMGGRGLATEIKGNQFTGVLKSDGMLRTGMFKASTLNFADFVESEKAIRERQITVNALQELMETEDGKAKKP